MGNGRREVWWQVQTPDAAPALPTPQWRFQEGLAAHLPPRFLPGFSPGFHSYYIFPSGSGLLFSWTKHSEQHSYVLLRVAWQANWFN